MDLSLTPEERAFQREVREFIAANLSEAMRRRQLVNTAVYPEPSVSRPWHAALHRKGWVAPLWPKEYGGTGWTPVQRFIFESECASAGAPVVYPIGVRLVAPVIIRFATETQKSFYLPRMLSGEDYWCQGYSEPNAGSDLASLQTRAVSDGDHYVVNGSKIWTTHAHHANRMFMLVRTSNAGRPQQGISFLLVDMASPGINVRPIVSMSGEHEINQVFFDDVRVPKANRVGAENEGWACAKYLLEFERGAGLFSARLRASLKRLREVADGLERQGMPGLSNPLNAARFAETSVEVDAFEALEWRILGTLGVGNSPGASSSILKLRASRLKQQIGALGIELMGEKAFHGLRPEAAAGGGEAGPRELIDTLVPEYLNGRAATIFGGTAEVQLGIIARSVIEG